MLVDSKQCCVYEYKFVDVRLCLSYYQNDCCSLLNIREHFNCEHKALLTLNVNDLQFSGINATTHIPVYV